MTSENNDINDEFKDSSIFNETGVSECFCMTGSVTYPDDRMTINYGLIIIILHVKRLWILIEILLDYYIVLNHI